MSRTDFLFLMFYKPPQDDPWINRAVARLDPPFSHVEVCFRDGMASSIYAGESVFMHKRSFANPNYTTMAVQVTEEQAKRAREYCESAARRGVPFDGVGMYMSRMPAAVRAAVGPCSGRGGTFCSKHVFEVMRHARVPGFDRDDPGSVSPSGLHRIARTSAPEMVAITPHRQRALMMGL